MSFGDAVRNVLNNYTNFNGRARRSEYWFWALAYSIVCLVASALSQAIGSAAMVLFLLVLLALFLPTIAVTVRRLHDTGRSGGWWFISLVPFVGGLILLVLLVQDSAPDNQYGPNPKGLAYPHGTPALG